MNSDLALDWDNLKAFLAVARAGSITSAAATLGYSQPTVWRRMGALEEALGVRLLKRGTRGVTLTPAGERLLQRTQLIDQEVALIQSLGRSELAPQGTIRLWTTDGIGGYWLPDKLGDFRERFPNVTIQVMCSSDLPAPGSIGTDILIVYEKPLDQDLVVLCEGRMVFQPFASRAYLARHGHPETMGDLAGHLVCDHTEYPDDGPWAAWREATGDSRVPYRTNSSMALGEATRRGMGISLQPSDLHNDREPDLVMLEIKGFDPPELVFWLVSHRETKDIPRVRAFIYHLRATLFERSRE
ncbi:LysR family transcriptional regulator [Azospirillum sp. SYSU D00513]|uniref:LysR family transcriptional regulator n=1 Tax=Azospirillum sp. SYSU D00513 TaxID=2812561 RepID=UPI001A957F02|nr:LysR family transcriptional regulator [Azospirillum sp. SYSU D00513]